MPFVSPTKRFVNNIWPLPCFTSGINLFLLSAGRCSHLQCIFLRSETKCQSLSVRSTCIFRFYLYTRKAGFYMIVSYTGITRRYKLRTRTSLFLYLFLCLYVCCSKKLEFFLPEEESCGIVFTEPLTCSLLPFETS